MKRALFTISIIALIALVGCKHDLQMAITELNGGSDTTIINPPPPVDTMICFESQILPLFISSCAKSGCHDAISAEKDYILTSYQAIMEEIVPFNPNNSKFLEVMLLPASENDAMPPLPDARITAEQIALITQWINQGAQNTTNCANTCDTTLFKYTADIKPIVSTYCNGCHQGTSPSAGINTSTYAGISAIVANGKLVGSVDHLVGYSGMPKSQPLMDNCLRTKIRKWALAGGPNN
jgi:hypothetical protein